MTLRRGRWTLLIAAASLNGSCIGEVMPGSTSELSLPVREGFESIADAMQPSCGTLDCHGHPKRNLRLFGERGLRLNGVDTSAEGATSNDEYEADYWAVVGLEPELLSTVLQDGGMDPERLILIRKGRGTTRHKGGSLMQPNDNLDHCLVEWLKGNILVDPCKTAARLAAPASP
jgi:hypothetical protein